MSKLVVLLVKREKHSTALKTELTFIVYYEMRNNLKNWFREKGLLVENVSMLKSILWYFHFSSFYLSVGGKQIFTRQVKVQTRRKLSF